MATDKKVKIDNGELRFDSELDFNFDDGFDILDTNKGKKKRHPIHDVLRGTADAAKSKLKTGSFWNSIAKKALPENYNIILEEFTKSKDVLSETYRESAKLLKPDLARIGRQIDNLVPEESKRIKKWTSKLRGHDSSDEYRGSPSSESMQTEAIMLAQEAIFDKLQQGS